MPTLYCFDNGRMVRRKRYFEVAMLELEEKMVAIGKRNGYSCVVMRCYRAILKSKVLPDRIIIARDIEGTFPETKVYRMKVKKQKVVIQDV